MTVGGHTDRSFRCIFETKEGTEVNKTFYGRKRHCKALVLQSTSFVVHYLQAILGVEPNAALLRCINARKYETRMVVSYNDICTSLYLK